MSHEAMSCLAQRLLSSIEEEDDWGSQVYVSIGNEGSGGLQHHPDRCCTIRCTCQNSLKIPTMPWFLFRLVSDIEDCKTCDLHWPACIRQLKMAEAAPLKVCMVSSL